MRRWLTNLARVSVRPRTTMRAMLDQGSGGQAIPLVVLAVLSGFFSDFNARAFAGSMRMQPALLALIVVCVLAGLVAIGVAGMWLLSWGATLVGRFLEGTGERKDVRQALAWGLAPIVWALLYRLPLSLFGVTGRTDLRVDQSGFHFDPGALSQGCGVAFLVVLLEVGLTAWYLTIASRTLAEAHRFSSWRGLGTLLLCFAAPLVAVLAAIMTAVT